MSLDDLAVVVPIGPGDGAWRELLPQLASLPAGARVVVVAADAADLPAIDAGQRAGLAAALVRITARRGRAPQQNAGARAADRCFLWFLHADSRLDAATLPALARCLRERPDGLGFFDLRFRADGPRATVLNGIGAWLRSRWLGLPFGDQGLFLARTTFQSIGGFDESLASGEDHALVWAAHRAGVPLVPAGAPLSTSARKYAQHGWLRTTARHLWLTAVQIGREARTGAR